MKLNKKPKIDFTRNKLLRDIFKQYDVTYALMLDTCDYIEQKDLRLFRKYVRKDMKRNLKKVAGVSRRLIRYVNNLLRQKMLEIEQRKQKLHNAEIIIKRSLPDLHLAKKPGLRLSVIRQS